MYVHEVDALDREAIREHWDQLWHAKLSGPNQQPEITFLPPITLPYSRFRSLLLPIKNNIS